MREFRLGIVFFFSPSSVLSPFDKPDVEKFRARLNDGLQRVGEVRRKGQYVVYAESHNLNKKFHLFIFKKEDRRGKGGAEGLRRVVDVLFCSNYSE